jgi:hypothetical protein
VKKVDGPVEDLNVINNVTSRLWAMKTARDALTETLDSLYKTAELENPATLPKTKSTEKPSSKKNEKNSIVPGSVEDEESVTLDNEDEHIEAQGEQEPAWEGFDSNSESVAGSVANSEIDSEDLSRYDGLIANSSDDDSTFDSDGEAELQRPSGKSRSKDPMEVSESEPETSDHESPEPQPQKAPKPSKPPPSKADGSTFLPTLMGGYWSGSEESATDDEDVAPPPRKNRMGQQARRALAERKFGAKAKHVQAGLVAKVRDKDWDPKRGARGENDKGRGARRGGSRNVASRGGRDGFVRSKEQFTGENAIEVTPRPRRVGKKDDTGVLHPSWQAKKMAKDAQKVATFSGKKVVFD